MALYATTLFSFLPPACPKRTASHDQSERLIDMTKKIKQLADKEAVILLSESKLHISYVSGGQQNTTPVRKNISDGIDLLIILLNLFQRTIKNVNIKGGMGGPIFAETRLYFTYRLPCPPCG